MKKRLPILLLAITIILSMTAPIHTGKAAMITNTVNLVSINENVYGDGYTWMNIAATLTFDNLNINTTDEYGFKIPPNATIILKGKNTITAADIALYCPGNVTIQGSGSLTLNSAVIGIACVSHSSSTSLKIADGTITINTNDYGIFGEFTAFSQIGGKLNISTSGESSYAIRSGNMQFNSGKLMANAPLISTGSINVNGSDIEINANRQALEAIKDITISNSSTIKTGDDSASLSVTNNYNNEKSIKITPKSTSKRGVLFDGKYHVFWDYAVFFLVIVGVGSVVGLPIYYKRKKTMRLIALQQEKNKTEGNAAKQTQINPANKLSGQKTGKKNTK